jgi:light-regulated signal transduction histidine kinase (bacteriophytochrome)
MSNRHKPLAPTDEQSSRLQWRAERERRARLEAEMLLEAKSRELYEANQQLARQAAGLAAQAAELKRSNIELERFASVASHDLQEPLRMVASYTQLLARRYRGRLDADADDFIRFAVDGATRMQALIDNLIMYSRVSTKEQHFEPIDCDDVLDRALANLQAAREDSGAIITRSKLPTVYADGSQLAQLFQNLVGNAIKFRGECRPLIRIGARRDADGWAFSVRDNGIGIDPKYVDQLFVVFKRLHTQSEYPGTGIGLAICRKIVERHGGRIWIESVPEQGTTFHFTLPEKAGRTSACSDRSDAAAPMRTEAWIE